MSQALALTRDALNKAPGIGGMFELEPVRHNAIRNYSLTTGKNEAAGAMYFERERVLLMKLLMGDQREAYEKCDRFTIYSAFIELMVSGRSLNNGESYIIPYGTVAQFQLGWRGRLEQINEIPGIESIAEPQVVYTSELLNFEYELGETPRIIKHIPGKGADRIASDKNLIEYVYWVVRRQGFVQTFIMSRSQVLLIRDTYSKPYIAYVKNGGKWPNGNPMKKPFWITNEDEAFKKTIINRGWKYTPKTARMKALDEKIKSNYDPETETIQETHDIDYGLADHKSGDSVDSRQITSGATAQQGGQEPIKGAEPTSQGGEKVPAKRSHKRKEPSETKTASPESKTVVTEKGETIDTDSGEVLNDGPTDDGNPVNDLPDLDNL